MPRRRSHTPRVFHSRPLHFQDSSSLLDLFPILRIKAVDSSTPADNPSSAKFRNRWKGALIPNCLLGYTTSVTTPIIYLSVSASSIIIQLIAIQTKAACGHLKALNDHVTIPEYVTGRSGVTPPGTYCSLSPIGDLHLPSVVMGLG
ncbi:unnamed protein product [Nezara viridula]|uniref:Uncharacterized protein n=1 Tax=Nezara viridula TaxID=85310 RepID=A0A9P0E444_NEZVI|nr:unnamed protein product [Nezara viridula]